MSLTTYYTARGTSSNGKIAPQFKQRPSKAKAQQRDCCCCPSGFYPSPSPPSFFRYKGQIISEQICGVLKFSKKATKYCQDFCPSLKNGLEARAKILAIFRCFCGKF